MLGVTTKTPECKTHSENKVIPEPGGQAGRGDYSVVSQGKKAQMSGQGQPTKALGSERSRTRVKQC